MNEQLEWIQVAVSPLLATLFVCICMKCICWNKMFMFVRVCSRLFQMIVFVRVRLLSLDPVSNIASDIIPHTKYHISVISIRMIVFNYRINYEWDPWVNSASEFREWVPGVSSASEFYERMQSERGGCRGGNSGAIKG